MKRVQPGGGTTRMVYAGQWLTAYLRWTPTPYKDAADAGMTIDAPQIKAILEGRARIEGDTRDGLEYIEEAASANAQPE